MKIFSKRLARTDVADRLSVRSRALQHLPRLGGDRRALLLPVEDEEGRRWDFRLRIRQDKDKKPELSRSVWLDFVRSKKLKTGDEIQFFKEEDEATGVIKYKVKVMREVRLFGVVIGYVPYHQAAC